MDMWLQKCSNLHNCYVVKEPKKCSQKKRKKIGFQMEFILKHLILLNVNIFHFEKKTIT